MRGGSLGLSFETPLEPELLDALCETGLPARSYRCGADCTPHAVVRNFLR
jgi:hypothetical protein